MAKARSVECKALAAIEVLAEQRRAKADITYGNLATKIGYGAARSIGKPLLRRVAAWCYCADLDSLAMLVVRGNKTRKPSSGLYEHIVGDNDPVTPENYKLRRERLCHDDRWNNVHLPSSPDEIAAAYERVSFI